MKYPIQKQRKWNRDRRKSKKSKRKPIPRIVVPSFFTLMNLLCGFTSLIYVVNDQLTFAAWLIVFAGLFDALDGFMARLANATSEFGIQLDSISDIVSFGVAPGFLVYNFALYELQFFGIIISALAPICGAVRLARFNVEAKDVKADFFRGLPIPAQAIMISSFYLTFSDKLGLFSEMQFGVNSVLIPVMIVLTALMVSTVPFDKIPRFDPTSIKQHKGRYLLFIGYVVAIILFQQYGLIAVFTIFIIRGLTLGGISFWKEAFGNDVDEDKLFNEDDDEGVVKDYS